VRTRQLELLAQLAHDDGGGRHRERTAEHDGHRRLDAVPPRGPAERERRRQHLQTADDEHLGLHRDHARQ
jgi:hypothetical protein